MKSNEDAYQIHKMKSCEADSKETKIKESSDISQIKCSGCNRCNRLYFYLKPKEASDRMRYGTKEELIEDFKDKSIFETRR